MNCGNTEEEKRLFEKYSNYSSEQLRNILDFREDYTEEAVKVAQSILDSRGNDISEEIDESLEWYYMKKGDKVGPVIEEHIIEQVKECHLSYETLVWKRGMTEWKTVDESEIGINKPVFKENGMSYLCLIVMVCMPIINTILWNLVDVYGLSPFIRILGFVPLIFWDVDWHYLKSLGIRGAWRIWGFFLPPVYLFIRAKKTNKNYVWGIVAVVVLLLMVLV